MIYHIFNLIHIHLSLNLIESIILKTSESHFFILIGDDAEKAQLYIEMFSKHDFKNFKIYPSFKALNKASVINRDSCILLHGGNYSWMAYFYIYRYKNLNWVCWGSGIFIKKTIKSRLSFLFKYLIYSYFRNIVVLMTPELTYLKQIYKKKNVFFIPYLVKIDDIYNFSRSKIDDSFFRKQNKKLIDVFLGNNFYSIRSYIDIIKNLSHLKGLIKIHCMLNYSLDPSSYEFQQLNKIGTEKFGSDFIVHTKLYSLKEYPDFMDICDIYICDVKTQTGLGAINTCLKLGKKIYLSGRNYDYISSLGFVIYPSSSLNGISLDNLRQYSIKDAFYNYDLYYNVFDQKVLSDRWNSFYKYILSR